MIVMVTYPPGRGPSGPCTSCLKPMRCGMDVHSFCCAIDRALTSVSQSLGIFVGVSAALKCSLHLRISPSSREGEGNFEHSWIILSHVRRISWVAFILRVYISA